MRQKTIKKAARPKPGEVEALELLAIEKLKQGDGGAAVELFRKVAGLRPRNVLALGNLSTALLAARRHAEALTVIDSTLALAPDSVQALVSRGTALHALGRNDEALDSYRAAMVRDPANLDAANNAGTLLGAMGRHEEALASYERALATRPDFPEALNNRGVSLAALERADEALACYARAAELRPAYIDPRRNRAELLAKLGRNDEALAAYDLAIAAAPKAAELISNRGTVLNSLNRHAEALEWYDRALKLKPAFTDALNNRGITLSALGRHEEALQCFRKAIAIKPDYVNAHWNEGLSLLRLGRFAEGWQKHEWRWKKLEFVPHMLDLKQPRWDGKEDVAGKTLLLTSEQGFGDSVQFSRYVNLLEARGARVLLFVPEPLVALFSASFPRALVFSKTNSFPPFDFQCPLLSLPLAFGTGLDSIPAPGSYIVAPPDRINKWARRMARGPEPRVGVVWAGSATHRNDINRSIALDEFAPLFSVPGVRFYSLQKDLSGAQASRLSALGNVALLGDAIEDFADTAGAIAALDLVITVDTAIAHLAAAMGKPTWILLPFVSDWRWLPGKDRSPWYPSARLFLQEKIGAWPAIIERVRKELAIEGAGLAARRTPAPAVEQPVGLEQALRQAYGFLHEGNLADAKAICQAVLQLQPDHPGALNIRGVTLDELGRHDEALQSYRAVIALAPDYVDARCNEALGLLRLGLYAEGFRKNEWRWKKPDAPFKFDLPQPLWLGKEDVAGKTVLVTYEQGLGDTVQFSRYVNLLEARGARVAFFVQEPLDRLMRYNFPRARVFSRTTDFPPFDFYCPLFSLPLAFGTELETIPAATNYISAPPDLAQAWAGRIGTAAEFRVGIAWAGNAEHQNDNKRSIELAAFAPLFSVPGVRFYSLQKDLSAGDAALLAAQANVTPIGHAFEDFADTAGAIAALDLVISVDTSVAHLAAAMGKPAWILLPAVSDWRWLTGQAATPWYPGAKLYRQEQAGAWPAVIDRVKADLAQLRAPAAPGQAIAPDDAVHRAAAFLRAGNLADAEVLGQAVLQVQPDHADALAVVAALRLKQGRADEAIDLFVRALAKHPGHLERMLNLAGALRLAGRHLEALPWYEKALAIAPAAANIHTNQAVSLIGLQRYDEAKRANDKALELDPANLAALNNGGVVLNELGRHEEALAAFERALAVKPDYTDALNNRGLALISMNRPAEAEQNYLKALRLRPEYSDAMSNLGLALAAMNRNVEALDRFGEALRLKPDYVDAHWNQSLVNLAQGNYAEGWRGYEWRWRKREFAPHKRDFHVPAWTGSEPLEGRTIFVHFEQGYGDTIQFVRYVGLLQERGAKVIVSVPESLRPLLQESFPQAGFFSGTEVLPPFDFHIAMLSLPLAFGTTVATIPARSPYLRAPAARLKKWRKRLGKRDLPRIGLAWAGNPKNRNDHNRSLPAQALRPLLLDGARFYSLQRDMRAEDHAALAGAPVELLGGELEDFADTAAAIMQMDLVISVDTAVAHLAGALGAPLWIMLTHAADWRWLVAREDSPWYPSARLFRQPAVAAVAPQIAAVRSALRLRLRK